MEKVIVTADKVGRVIVPYPSNPIYGYIRVEQKRLITNYKGEQEPKVVTALVQDLVTNLKKRGWVVGQELPGKIVFKEQLNPFDAKYPEKDYKVAGKTKIVCAIYGEPIYRKAFYDLSESAEDSFITDDKGDIMEHTNKDDIRAAYARLNKH